MSLSLAFWNQRPLQGGGGKNKKKRGGQTTRALPIWRIKAQHIVQLWFPLCFVLSFRGCLLRVRQVGNGRGGVQNHLFLNNLGAGTQIASPIECPLDDKNASLCPASHVCILGTSGELCTSALVIETTHLLILFEFEAALLPQS
jgi:hypothetical protein